MQIYARMRERASVLRLIYVKRKAPDSQKVLRKIKLNTTLQNTTKINVFRPGWMSRRKKSMVYCSIIWLRIFREYEQF